MGSKRRNMRWGSHLARGRRVGCRAVLDGELQAREAQVGLHRHALRAERRKAPRPGPSVQYELARHSPWYTRMSYEFKALLVQRYYNGECGASEPQCRVVCWCLWSGPTGAAARDVASVRERGLTTTV
jgi:hypothetical protein